MVEEEIIEILIMKCRYCGTMIPYNGQGDIVVHCVNPEYNDDKYDDVTKALQSECEQVGIAKVPYSVIMRYRKV